MSTKKLAHLGSSIVFIVEKPNLGTFTQDFIEDKGIFPGFTFVNETSLPVLSLINYANGYSFEAIDNRIKVEVNHPEALPLDGLNVLDDLLEEAAEIIMNEVGYMRFSALGINFKTVVDNCNLGAFGERLPEDANIVRLSFQHTFEDFLVTMALSAQEHQKTKTPVVIVDSNFHFGVEEGAGKDKRLGGISRALGMRAACLKKVQELVNETRF